MSISRLSIIGYNIFPYKFLYAGFSGKMSFDIILAHVFHGRRLYGPKLGLYSVCALTSPQTQEQADSCHALLSPNLARQTLGGRGLGRPGR